ncbi:unnamed protein product [Closterium sp. NIES-53]
MFHWCSPFGSPAATCPSVPSATCGAGCPSSSTFLSASLSPPSPASPDRSSPPSLLSAMYALLGPRNTSSGSGIHASVGFSLFTVPIHFKLPPFFHILLLLILVRVSPECFIPFRVASRPPLHRYPLLAFFPRFFL